MKTCSVFMETPLYLMIFINSVCTALMRVLMLIFLTVIFLFNLLAAMCFADLLTQFFFPSLFMV